MSYVVLGITSRWSWSGRHDTVGRKVIRRIEEHRKGQSAAKGEATKCTA